MLATVVVIGVLVAGLVLLHNRLVRLRNRTERGWAQIDVQLQRRHDLVPNLVETVRGYAAHERHTFEQVMQARQAAISATGPDQVAGAETGLANALSHLFAVVESYPTLKADRAFLELQRELAATEDRVAYARRYYNDAVQAYDTALEQFPGVLVAGPFGFDPADYFEVEDHQVRAAPQVGR